jgi:2-polyprenyl-3-methyl-5-hydroxy-6-metoxy-1,4-benzoquinol methylase
MAKKELKERLLKDPEGEKRIINKTDLNPEQACERNYIHRDLLAHQSRWSNVIKWAAKLKNKDELTVLDVGCGSTIPLLRTLYVNKLKPRYYHGMDFRKLSITDSGVAPNFEAEITQADFAEGLPVCKYGDWGLITFLEVLEHNSKEAGIKILENIKIIMSPSTILFLSTPCFNDKSHADNHIYEWRYQELKDQLESMFVIEKHYGTFASQGDIEPVLTPAEREYYDEAKEYFDSNFTAILLAFAHPEVSRNCLWRLKLKR